MRDWYCCSVDELRKTNFSWRVYGWKLRCCLGNPFSDFLFGVKAFTRNRRGPHTFDGDFWKLRQVVVWDVQGDGQFVDVLVQGVDFVVGHVQQLQTGQGQLGWKFLQLVSWRVDDFKACCLHNGKGHFVHIWWQEPKPEFRLNLPSPPRQTLHKTKEVIDIKKKLKLEQHPKIGNSKNEIQVFSIENNSMLMSFGKKLVTLKKWPQRCQNSWTMHVFDEKTEFHFFFISLFSGRSIAFLGWCRGGSHLLAASRGLKLCQAVLGWGSGVSGSFLQRTTGIRQAFLKIGLIHVFCWISDLHICTCAVSIVPCVDESSQCSVQEPDSVAWSGLGSVSIVVVVGFPSVRHLGVEFTHRVLSGPHCSTRNWQKTNVWIGLLGINRNVIVGIPWTIKPEWIHRSTGTLWICRPHSVHLQWLSESSWMEKCILDSTKKDRSGPERFWQERSKSASLGIHRQGKPAFSCEKRNLMSFFCAQLWSRV